MVGRRASTSASGCAISMSQRCALSAPFHFVPSVTAADVSLAPAWGRSVVRGSRSTTTAPQPANEAAWLRLDHRRRLVQPAASIGFAQRFADAMIPGPPLPALPIRSFSIDAGRAIVEQIPGRSRRRELSLTIMAGRHGLRQNMQRVA